MQKSILIILGFAALLILLFVLGSKNSGAVPDAKKLSAASTLSAREDSYDFGEISMKAGLVRHTFTIENSSSTSPLIIAGISTSCMCTEAFLVRPSPEIDGAPAASGTDADVAMSASERLGPFGMPGHGGATRAVREEVPAGESREMEVVFDPAAHGPAGVGRIERAVFIEDEAGGTQTLTIKALVTP